MNNNEDLFGEGRGGAYKRGGLLTFFPWKGGLIWEGWGWTEVLRYFVFTMDYSIVFEKRRQKNSEPFFRNQRNSINDAIVWDELPYTAVFFQKI